MTSRPRAAKPEEKPRKVDRRILKTDAAIREAFGRMAAHEDFRKISITALAAEANIDRKTFYLHYQSIDDLAETLAREAAVKMAEDIQKAMEKYGDEANAGDLLRELMAYTPSGEDIWRPAAAHASLEDLVSHLEKPLGEVLLSLYRAHHPEASVDEERVGYGVSFMVAGSLAMYKRWLAEQPPFPFEDLTEMSKTVSLAVLAGLTQHLSAVSCPATPS